VINLVCTFEKYCNVAGICWIIFELKIKIQMQKYGGNIAYTTTLHYCKKTLAKFVDLIWASQQFDEKLYILYCSDPIHFRFRNWKMVQNQIFFAY
jgi:adenine-specific DNA methylase